MRMHLAAAAVGVSMSLAALAGGAGAATPNKPASPLLRHCPYVTVAEASTAFGRHARQARAAKADCTFVAAGHNLEVTIAPITVPDEAQSLRKLYASHRKGFTTVSGPGYVGVARVFPTVARKHQASLTAIKGDKIVTVLLSVTAKRAGGLQAAVIRAGKVAATRA